MITLLSLFIIGILLWVGFIITGAFFKAIIWLFIQLPIALILWDLGVACCCTLILIPVGVKLFGVGGRVVSYV
ncbi:MAG: hypothetical protein E7262_08835 [Lachnospiraceae bacterium]|nr:hypothetical protein [Lachnospiraceae bacterium]